MRNLNAMTDEELALAYVEGDNRAFDLLLSRTEVKLFSYIMFVVHDTEVANDVFQDTFVKAIMRLQAGAYNNNGKFISWLFRIAHNVIVDGYRSTHNIHFIEQGKDNDLSTLKGEDLQNESTEQQMVRSQVFLDVKKLVTFLPANQREVIYMRYYQQMSFKEIAECTNVSINTSLGRMRYALNNLRRMARKNNISLQID